jgi:hypothetical protein
MEHIGHDVFVSKEAQAIISLTSATLPGDTGSVKKISKGAMTANIKYWGEKNTLPDDREAVAQQNGHVAEMMKTKRDFIIGGGLHAYRRKWVDGKEVKEYMETPNNIQEYFDSVNINRYLMKACKNLLLHGNVFTEFVRYKRKPGLASVECLECRHVRAEKQDSTGYVRNFYWSGMWSKLTNVDATLEKIPAYDPDRRQEKFVYHTGDDLLYDDYYYIPGWWASKNWALLANQIPDFHLANILNGYTIRFHIEIPKDYFYDRSSSAQTSVTTGEGLKMADKAKQEFKAKMDEFLASKDNAGKTVFTTYEIERHLGKDYPGVKIHPINVDLKDEALLKLYEAATKAITAAQGIHPTLANVDTAGKLSSGSEMRNAHLVYLKTKTPVMREILLEPIYMLHRSNGWPDYIRWEFRDIEITTLDNDPTGSVDPVADPMV